VADRIIAIGASAGGVETLKRVVSDLPENLAAAVLIVLHLPPFTTSYLPEILDHAGPLPARQAESGAPLESGRIYVAPPDHHLLVEHDRIQLSRGPRENRNRPSIDTLFRSVSAYGDRAIGVVLSGTLDDGTVGLWEIKRRGGIAVVQDPSDALFPDMPRNAIAHVKVDFIVKLEQLGALLGTLAEQPGEAIQQKPESAAMPSNSTDFTCPECHGALREVQYGTAKQYACRVGHTYTGDGVIAAHSESQENALWTAVAYLEEGAELLDRLSDPGPDGQRFRDAAERKRRQAALIRDVLKQFDSQLT